MELNKKGNNPIVAIGYLIKGLQLLTSTSLRKFIWIPILINVVLYSAALVLGYYYLNDLIAQFIPSWVHWLNWILWPLFLISFFIAGFFTFTVLANLLASPFYGRLSTETRLLIGEQLEAVKEPPFTQVIKAECKRAGYLLSRAIPLVIISMIPGVNVIAPFLWALFGAWGMALEYLAYPLEAEGLLFEEQQQTLKSIRLGALSFGGVAAMGLTIPFVNIIVAPAAVIGATLYLNDMKKLA